MDSYAFFLFFLNYVFDFNYETIKSDVFDTVVERIGDNAEIKEIADKEGSENDEEQSREILSFIGTFHSFVVVFRFLIFFFTENVHCEVMRKRVHDLMVEADDSDGYFAKLEDEEIGPMQRLLEIALVPLRNRCNLSAIGSIIFRMYDKRKGMNEKE